MAVVLPRGWIISAFVIREDEDYNPVANMIFSSPEHTKASLSLLNISKGVSINDPRALLIKESTSLFL